MGEYSTVFMAHPSEEWSQNLTTSEPWGPLSLTSTQTQVLQSQPQQVCSMRVWVWSRSVVSDSLWPHGPEPTRLLCPWNFSGKSSGVGCHFLLQGISQPKDQTWVSPIAGRRFTIWATREAHSTWQMNLGDRLTDIQMLTLYSCIVSWKFQSILQPGILFLPISSMRLFFLLVYFLPMLWSEKVSLSREVIMWFPWSKYHSVHPNRLLHMFCFISVYAIKWSLSSS